MKKSILFFVAIVLAGGVLCWKMFQSENSLPTGIAGVNGRITLERIDVASLYSGKVEEVYVKEGDNVQKDQVLVRLSSTQAQSQVDAMQAQIEQAKAQKQQALDNVIKAQSDVTAKQQQFSIAKLELDNAKKLRRANLISATELEQRQTSFAAAQASLTASKASVTQAQSAVEQAEALIAQAQASYQQAKSHQDDLLIRSPIDGRVEYKLVNVGNVVGIGGRVISILDLQDTYINIFLPSQQSNQLKIGSEGRIVIDGVDAVFPAKVTFIASNAQFTPKSVETAEERAKLMFKVKLQIPEEVIAQHPDFFKGGMMAMGYVKYDDNAQWPADLAVKLPQ
ncbi:HlyD family secretion protein [Pasteurella langaaensis DSM 22999]|uniref:HlyD family secretion protein n=1 Tax=Alitibacter langaaensis DSM 22999 TaxID=1122935 RepID=A0A2U0TA64_9PAST|nr:HlyD family efflux transporter periplasmic adaptor subunit [Pasteurella langaaensis]PVX40468.1 HlyD family secretion protein [Pasteurella langaaensis DSM 22999]